VKVFDRIVHSCPDQAMERYEEISYLVKNNDSLNVEDFVRCNDDRAHARHCDDIAAGTQSGIDQLRKLFANAPLDAVVDGEDGEGAGASGPAIGLVQDLTSLNRHVYNQAGIELGEYGALILQKSLK